MVKIADVRPSPIAGRWYNGDPDQLARQIDHYLFEAVIPPLSGKVLGVIAPHAGHRYSGKTAAHAFKAVEGQSFDLVVVASPLHGYHPAPLLTSAHQRYATPLGEVKVDHVVIDQLNLILKQKCGVPLVPVAYDEE
ncbi:MAG: AmmeMemoRadiSam system protein B, partial [Bellilinea sp.]